MKRYDLVERGGREEIVLSSVSKAGRVLGLFSGDSPEWGVREAAGHLQIPRSTAHAMLSSLAEVGLLRRTGQGRYRLDSKVLSLGRSYLDSSDVRVHAKPTIRALVEQFGTTVHLASLTDEGVIYLDKVEGVHTGHISASDIGRRLPPHCCAVGKVLLAHSDWDEAERILENTGMPRYTRRTICSSSTLRDEFNVVRDQGFASDVDEALDGLTCYAAPIYGEGRRVTAAVSLSMRTAQAQSHADRYHRLAVAAGAQITKNLRNGSSDFVPLAS
jgi:IclR family transcriptional regulator, KDG regulon repressor